MVSSLWEMVGDKPGLLRISIFYLGFTEIFVTRLDKAKGNCEVHPNCD